MKFIKDLLFIIVCFSAITNSLQAQELTPKSNKALINLLLLDGDEQPVEQQEIIFKSKKNGTEFNSKTDNKGLTKILLPINDKYRVDIGSKIGYDKFEIPDKKFHQLNYKIYYEPEQKQKQEQTLLKLYVHHKGEPLSEKVEIVNKKTNEIFSTHTDESGKAELLIPNNAKYQVNFKNAKNYEEFELADVQEFNFDINYGGSIKNKLYPTLDSVLLCFQYNNLKNEGVPDETLMVKTELENKTFKTTTNENGYAEILLPKGDSCHFSVKHFKDFKTTKFKVDKELRKVNLELKYISSKEYEKRKAKRLNRSKSRQANRLKIAVSQNVTSVNPNDQNIDEYIENNHQHLKESTLGYKDSLDKSPRFFEKTENTVNAVLYRFRNKWKNKFIVTDVTCSMEPYIHEVLQWHILKLIADGSNHYLFFNDGDGKANSHKEIGNTGGIHYCHTDNIDTVLTRLFNSRKYGCSGDIPENDLEALLKAQKYMSGKGELILVADNYSSVRDIELLKKLNTPVHIIICGEEIPIHPHYLQIAHETEGSIHTIEEDIMHLSKINEGAEITISGDDFYFTKGKFNLKE